MSPTGRESTPMPSRTVSPVSTWAETGGLNDHAVRLENLNSLSQSHHTKRALTRESLNSLTTVSITRPLKSHSLTPYMRSIGVRVRRDMRLRQVVGGRTKEKGTPDRDHQPLAGNPRRLPQRASRAEGHRLRLPPMQSPTRRTLPQTRRHHLDSLPHQSTGAECQSFQALAVQGE